MLQFRFSPDWFYGIDSIFEIVSIIVALLIAFSSYKIYKFTKEAKYKYFSLSFVLIAIAYVFKILTNFTLFRQSIIEKTIGDLTYTFLAIQKSDIFLILGYLLFRFLMLIGLIGIYLILDKQSKQTEVNKRIIVLLTFFAFITAMISHYYFIIFHITAALLLGFITYLFYNNCKKKCTQTSRLVSTAFLIIFISQLLFILVQFNTEFYVVAEVFQLLGFIILLITYFLVLRK